MVIYDNEIEAKEIKILAKDKIKPQLIQNHDFSKVITPSSFYLVAKPFPRVEGNLSVFSADLLLPLPYMETVYFMVSILPALTHTVQVILPLHRSGVFFLRSLLSSV